MNIRLNMDNMQIQQRHNSVQRLEQDGPWDMIVIGGGITGAGIARETARQGKKVLLLEQKDFAWGTSSRSSKMVHGGLRYLAAGNFKLTSHSVKERERLMNEAPGLVELLPYSWPHYRGGFPGPKVFNAVLAVYDAFAGKRYRNFFNKQDTIYELPFINETNLIGSTRFADATTDDARLVMRVLDEAEQDGACVLNYCKAQQLLKDNDKVSGVIVEDVASGKTYSVKASVVVSATGAWADKFRSDLGQKASIRPLRGSHLVLPHWRLPLAQSITLKHPEDGRSMFVYPWEGMTIIGTTDLDNPAMDIHEPSIHADEVTYLLKAVNTLYPSSKIIKDDIVATFAGVRPIVSGGALNPSSEKRDHSIWDDNGLISVSGGKLTTFRLIALDVLKKAKKYLPSLSYKDYGQNIFSKVTQIPEALLALDAHWQKKLTGFYGNKVTLLCEKTEQEGWAFIPGTQTFWAQVRYAAAYEKVVNLDDLLLRRTRVGLFLVDGGKAFEEKIKTICQQELGWDDAQWSGQWDAYQTVWNQYYSVPLK